MGDLGLLKKLLAEPPDAYNQHAMRPLIAAAVQEIEESRDKLIEVRRLLSIAEAEMAAIQATQKDLLARVVAMETGYFRALPGRVISKPGATLEVKVLEIPASVQDAINKNLTDQHTTEHGAAAI